MVLIQVNKATTLIWRSSLTLMLWISSLTPGHAYRGFSPHLVGCELLVEVEAQLRGRPADLPLPERDDQMTLHLAYKV